MKAEIKKIEAAIQKSGYRKNFIAEKCGTTYPHLWRMLNGERTLTDEFKDKLYNLLEIK